MATERLKERPAFASCLPVSGYAARLAQWAGLTPEAWLADVNSRAATQALSSAAGRPLRFVFAEPGAPRLSALAYECAIHEQGLIHCRRDGGFDHDRWNAAVWLRWPRTTAALNQIHAREAQSMGPSMASADGASADRASAGPPVPGQRSRARDLATLIDESGLAWLSSRPDCDALLRERQWQALFIDQREALSRGVVPQVIGHGLLGKLARPYKRLSAQVLIVPVDALAATDDEASDAAIAAAVTAAATAAAARVTAAPAGPGASACLPLPILALPGWCEANRDAAFYDDTSAFRRTSGTSGGVGAGG